MPTRVLPIALIAALLSIGVSAQTPQPPTAKAAPAPGVAMNNHYLDQALRGMTSEVEGGDGRWRFTWFDVEMVLVADEGADRMRVMVPVDDASHLTAEQLRFLLEVDFERALDAKYAIWRDSVWVTFVHPLSSLTPDELAAGVLQVVNLFSTYGSDYSSTGLTFGGN